MKLICFILYIFLFICERLKCLSMLWISKRSLSRSLPCRLLLFKGGIYGAYLANYGFYWTKLSLFLSRVGWDDIIRCTTGWLEEQLEATTVAQSLNGIASYLQNDPVSQFWCIVQNTLSNLLLPLSQGNIVQSAMLDGKSKLQSCKERIFRIFIPTKRYTLCK